MSTRTARYDAYKAVRGLVEELRNVKLLEAEPTASCGQPRGFCSQTPPPTLKPWRLA
jgi:hypothetical protein